MVKSSPRDDWRETLFLPVKIRGLFELTRPFTLLAPILGGLSAALISYRVHYGPIPLPYFSSEFPFFGWGFQQMLPIVWGIMALVLVNAASNVLNQVHDRKIDQINKPYRPIPAGIIHKDEARSMAWLLYLIVLWRASFLNGAFAFFILLLMLMTIAYSQPPVRLKKRLWVANASIAVSRGMLGFVAAWCIFDNNPFDDAIPWLLGSVMALFVFGTITTKDFGDIKGDAKYGIRTLPVVYGVKTSMNITIPFFILPFVVMDAFLLKGMLMKEVWWMNLLLAYAIYVAVGFKELTKAHDAHFENSAVWKHMYILLMAFQMGFCVVYMVFHPGPG